MSCHLRGEYYPKLVQRAAVTDNFNLDQAVYCAPQSWDTKRCSMTPELYRVGGKAFSLEAPASFSLQPLTSWEGN